jgi:predicted methyltransferase
MGVIYLAAAAHVYAMDRFDAAVAHSGRTAEDLKRDSTDHPAEILRLAGINRGMRVADILAGDGYYSELLSYLVGPKGKVFLINNEAYDRWSDGLSARSVGASAEARWSSARSRPLCKAGYW